MAVNDRLDLYAGKIILGDRPVSQHAGLYRSGFELKQSVSVFVFTKLSW